MFIVFDLDDTLADTSHRQCILDEEFEKGIATDKWDKFFQACDKDEPKWPIIHILNDLALANHKVEIWTGRSDLVLEKTKAWLDKYLNPTIAFNLRMRQQGDFRHDTELKAQWLEQAGKPDLVFDDRTSVVKWWRSQGITCCQIADNNY